MPRLRALVAAAVVVLLLAQAGAAQGPAGFPASSGPDDVDPDNVLLRVGLAENGSADWTVRYRIRLETENETAAFEELRTDIEENESTYRDQFASRIRASVRAAENATGREMQATRFDVSASTESIGQRYGVITYTFRWENFAVAEGDRIRAGDAIAGLYLDGETTLQISAPEGHQFTEVTPEPPDRRRGLVEWTGPLTFGTDEPTVVAEPAGGLGILPLAAAIIVVLVVGSAATVLYRRRRGAPGGEPTPAAEETERESTPEEEPREESAAEPPPELLSNEEQVLQLLEQHGGRMKQQQIVEELDWTEAKTSQVLSGMREDDEVESFRIGRENVVRIPTEEEEDER